MSEECAHCHEELHGELHAVKGLLYCSKRCAVEHLTQDIIRSAEFEALKAYDEAAETVQASDIGID